MHGAEPCYRAGALKHTTISRVPSPNCRSSVIGLAIAGNPENDGHLSPWQKSVGHEIIPDTHKNGCANEVTTGLTLGLFVILLRSLCSADRNGREHLTAHKRQELVTRRITGT